ncbi:MAG: hypothetical protein B6U87_01755 [Candidatus Aenigmarchaeota archaeon ex4484_52]|nr:MAG: hypothetical protein B6U87_01755 [Candidatus Aenigmarchaeota archaeon ex4484_52]
MKYKSYNNFFNNFSNKTRFNIILALWEECLSAGDIAKKLQEEQSKISHNLQKLTKCNILNVRKKGKQRIYCLNKQTVIPILELAKKHVEKYCLDGCKNENAK